MRFDLMKSEQSLFNDVFFPLFKKYIYICEKAEEEGQNWENSKACTFLITHTVSISSIADEFLLIFVKSQKIHKITKFYPR